MEIRFFFTLLHFFACYLGFVFISSNSKRLWFTISQQWTKPQGFYGYVSRTSVLRILCSRISVKASKYLYKYYCNVYLSDLFEIPKSLKTLRWLRGGGEMKKGKYERVCLRCCEYRRTLKGIRQSENRELSEQEIEKKTNLRWIRTLERSTLLMYW